MRTNEKLWEIAMAMYRQMYKEAEPSADIDKLMDSGETQEPNWFMKYYLDQDRQIEIMEEHFNKNKCDKAERKVLSKEMYLGCSPKGYKNEEEK